jgi:hypothetical protein
MAGSTFFEGLEARAFARDRVLVCTGVQSAQWADATDPSIPNAPRRLVSSASDPSFPRCQHLAASADVVYFSNRGDEVQPVSFIAAFDVSTDPAREIVTLSQPSRTVEGIDARGSLLFAALHEDGVGVFELGDATLTERAVHTAGIDNAWSVRVDGTTLFVAAGPAGLVSVDVASPGSPSTLGSLALGGAAQALELDPARGLAFVATGASGVAIVDVSDPRAPALAGHIETPGSALDLAVSGTHLAVADWRDLRVFDVADPTAPRTFASERPLTTGVSPRVLGVAAIDDLVFASEWTGFTSYRLHADRAAPDLFLSEADVSFGDVGGGESAARALLVANTGNAPLTIGSAETSSAAFRIATDLPLTLAPAEEAAIEIEVHPTDGAAATATLDICSDDPDEPSRSAQLAVNPALTGVGDPAPTVEVELTTGELWKLADARGHVVVLSYFATF